MGQFESGCVIIGMFFLVIFIGAVRRKVECVINFVLRIVVGTLIIYFTNQILHRYGLNFSVALNPLSILVSGFLGLPGVAVLYGINFYKT